MAISNLARGIEGYPDGDRIRDIALGNTFGGTALSSYGGFWISVGIILTPGGFRIEESYGAESNGNFNASFGL